MITINDFTDWQFDQIDGCCYRYYKLIENQYIQIYFSNHRYFVLNGVFSHEMVKFYKTMYPNHRVYKMFKKYYMCYPDKCYSNNLEFIKSHIDTFLAKFFSLNAFI